MARVIVTLDVEEVDRLGDARPMIELAEIAAQRRIVPDLPQVALEVAKIDGIEADQRGEQPPVASVSRSPHKERLVRQPRLQPVERLEQGANASS